ncbi:YqaA family protein [Aureimonas frigidaquae]|uniref:Putative membrane protein n=1 Tax=Aureimonas frigidaquae TaxID=424757 RepID=A0A0P0Z3T4_9HYPH|nr:YqaA family protein [Aureimonas frigidaquae]BAT28455.1 putative membrane protein [Aureimonas frigidaquae]
MSEIAAYGAMFWTALLAATILPGASEVMFVAFLLSKTGDPWIMLACATLGNTAGSVVNWCCGRFLAAFSDRRWFPVPQSQLTRWSYLFERYGLVSLLFSWAPVVGDVLTVAAGILRVPLGRFIALVFIGKLLRYLVVAAGVRAAFAAG